MTITLIFKIVVDRPIEVEYNVCQNNFVYSNFKTQDKLAQGFGIPFTQNTEYRHVSFSTDYKRIIERYSRFIRFLEWSIFQDLNKQL